MKWLIFLLASFMAAPQNISWDKTVHDFGDVSVKDGPLSCEFTVTNNGTEDLVIFEVVSSCGCTDVQWTRGTIAPGGSGTIKATYKNEDGPMAFDKTLTVYLTGVKRPVILRLRGVVHEQKKSLSQLFGGEKLGDFGLKERSFKLGTLKQGRQVSQQSTVANLGNKPLQVDFTQVSPQLSVSVSPNPIPPQSTARLSYTVTADPALYGRNTYTATPVLGGRPATAPLEFLAWTQESFDSLSPKEKEQAPLPYFSASTADLGIVRSGERKEVVFTCTNKGKSPFRILKADTENPALQLLEAPEIGPQEKGSVRFTLDTSALPKGEAVIMVTLTTNSPLRPQINLFAAGEIR